MTELSKTQRTAWNQFHSVRSDRESASGSGSYLENTREVRSFIAEIIDKLKITSIVDVPCGDWNWMRLVNLKEVDYEGIDINQKVVRKNKKMFANDSMHTSFECADILHPNFAIPHCDLVICRDLFMHLPFVHIKKVLQKIRVSKCKYALLSSWDERITNNSLDIPSKHHMVVFRPVDITHLMFGLSDPIAGVVEHNISPHKQMLLFDMRRT